MAHDREDEAAVTGPDEDPAIIDAIMPRGPGRKFIVYGDACSGVAGAPHQATFAGINRVASRIRPPPDFVIFPGDEIIGLTEAPDVLRAQWRYWLDVEMKWFDRRAIPLYHTTSNHTTYDEMSEAVFREMLPHLPRNGPPDQLGLSYFVRDGDLLMIFVNTSWSGLGGEGHVETQWLAATLGWHADARHKLVVGHHPVHPVNGYSAACQHVISPDHADAFWRVLVDNGVLAYICSHILAFDVQVHGGVLQITTAGAGTRYRMPEGIEYLHCLQAALDAQGLRYQVLDASGCVRERLSWPVALPAVDQWSPIEKDGRIAAGGRVLVLHCRGRAAGGPTGWQTLLAAAADSGLSSIWLGLRGPSQRLSVIVGPERGRSPHYWEGPVLPANEPFDFQVMLHADMGPGGVLYREAAGAPWTSFRSSSAWGLERLVWPSAWHLGHGQRGKADRPFGGRDLVITAASVQPAE